MKKIIRNILITLVCGVFIFYLTLPPINVMDLGFWMFVLVLLTIYFILASITKVQVTSKKGVEIKSFSLNKCIYAIGLIIVGIMVINLVMSPLFNAKAYANRIIVDSTEEFSDGVAPVNFNAIPLLDKDSSQKLGDRTMGTMTDLVSQFYVSDLYTQINYNDDIVRVTPLEYAGIIKYFSNRDEGVKGYITVNSTTGDSKLVQLEKGMRYMPSAMFFENLDRKLRMDYPTKIFGNASFEIDNEGNPYWIVPTISYKGIGLRKEINGVIVLDPITGDSVWYKTGEVPSWIDHVYDASLIIEQFNNWGEYKNGFWNSVFGQKNVVNTTVGYSYLAMNDAVYVYTGVTSVSSDESNLGFILTNLRTKETHYYGVPGAEEFSAMASAEGLVQEKGYKATFPLLINLNNKPTYLMSLKDNAGLVKMYAFVDLVDYQKVITSDASLGVEAAAKKYLGEANNVISSEIKEENIVIKSIKDVVLDGTTYYYLTDINNNRYSVNIKTNKNLLPFLEINNNVNIKYYEDNNIRIITDIS